jgi:hypothetical protein
MATAEDLRLHHSLELLLEAASNPGNGISPDLLTESLRHLSAAPPGDIYDLALLRGLSLEDDRLVAETAKAILSRLKRFADDPEAMHNSMREVVEYCFVHLAVEDTGTVNGRRVARETAAKELIDRVLQYLESQPDKFEGVRSWLLARIPDLQHSGGFGLLQRTLVAFQERLATGSSPSAILTAELDRRRRLNSYVTLTTSDSTLRAYLEGDARLCLAEARQEYFQSYRILLAKREPKTAGPAMKQALQNLIHWLDEAPQESDSLVQLAHTALLARVGSSVPREQLDARIARHLEAHIELLPGANYPEDFLRSVRTRFDRPLREALFLDSMKVLQRLPAVRYRSEEIERFVLADGRTARTPAMWMGMLSWVASCARAPQSFQLRLSGNRSVSASHEQMVRTALSHSERMRRLLHRLATDLHLGLAEDAAEESAIRTEAWRQLLRSFPPTIDGLLSEGVLQHSQRLFAVTLDEAANSARRDLWPLLLVNFRLLLGDGPERESRAEAIIKFFGSTRDYTAVQGGEGVLGPVMNFAFDDPDPLIRQHAEQALVAAGYSQELQRERQRRLLLALEASLLASNQRINELNQQLGQLWAEMREVQDSQSRAELAVQNCCWEADSIAVRSAIAVSRLQIEIEDLQEKILEAAQRAIQQKQFLDALHRAITIEQTRSAQAQVSITGLVRRRDAARETQARMIRERDAAIAENEQLRRRRAGMRGGTPEADRNIANLASTIENNARQVNDLNRRIPQAAEEARELQDAINTQAREIEGIAARLAQREGEFRAGSQERAQILRRIDELTRQQQNLQARKNSEEAQTQRELEQNHQKKQSLESELRAIHQRGFEVTDQINRTEALYGDQVTASQNLDAQLRAGRDEHERIAEAARPQAQLADQAGIHDRQEHDAQQTFAQEGLVAYAEAIRHSTRLENPLPSPKETRAHTPTTERIRIV